jgi:hypothetical protein
MAQPFALIEEDGMHARVTRFKGAPENFDRNVEIVKSQALPALQKIPGFQGCYILGDRKAGNSIGVFFFDSAESLASSRDAANKIREGAMQATASEVQSVEEFEVIADSGQKVSRTANAARVGTQKLDPARIDEGREAIKARGIPAIQQFSGNQGAVFMVDRASGLGFTLTLFDNSASLDASREGATQLRKEILERIGGTPTSEFEEYEITARAESPVGAQA